MPNYSTGLFGSFLYSAPKLNFGPLYTKMQLTSIWYRYDGYVENVVVKDVFVLSILSRLGAILYDVAFYKEYANIEGHEEITCINRTVYEHEDDKCELISLTQCLLESGWRPYTTDKFEQEAGEVTYECASSSGDCAEAPSPV
jgi:hypothetical protein